MSSTIAPDSGRRPVASTEKTIPDRSSAPPSGRRRRRRRRRVAAARGRKQETNNCGNPGVHMGSLGDKRRRGQLLTGRDFGARYFRKPRHLRRQRAATSPQERTLGARIPHAQSPRCVGLCVVAAIDGVCDVVGARRRSSTGRVVMAAASCVNAADETMKRPSPWSSPARASPPAKRRPTARTRIRCSSSRRCRTALNPEDHRAAERQSELPDPPVSAFSISRPPRRPHRPAERLRGAAHEGQVPGTEIFYSIQANIMRPGLVVPNAVRPSSAPAARSRIASWPRWRPPTIRRRQPLYVPAVAKRRDVAADRV